MAGRIHRKVVAKKPESGQAEPAAPEPILPRPLPAEALRTRVEAEREEGVLSGEMLVTSLQEEPAELGLAKAEGGGFTFVWISRGNEVVAHVGDQPLRYLNLVIREATKDGRLARDEILWRELYLATPLKIVRANFRFPTKKKAKRTFLRAQKRFQRLMRAQPWPDWAIDARDAGWTPPKRWVP